MNKCLLNLLNKKLVKIMKKLICTLILIFNIGTNEWQCKKVKTKCDVQGL